MKIPCKPLILAVEMKLGTITTYHLRLEENVSVQISKLPELTMDNEVSETSFVIVLLKNIYILLHNVLFRHLHLASLLCKKQMNCELK